MAEPAADAAKDRPRSKVYTQLWFLVLVAIAAGIAFGLAFPEPAKDAKWLADAFIQLIQTITGPVIFITVVIGIASLSSIARAGGLALRALGYFLGPFVENEILRVILAILTAVSISFLATTCAGASSAA